MVPPIVDTTLGGVMRGGRTDGQPVLSLDAFTQKVLTQLEGDKDEVLVGLSIGTRHKGDALFPMMNRQAMQAQQQLALHLVAVSPVPEFALIRR